MIKYKLRTDATATGSSYYEALLFCPRRHRLDQERKAIQGVRPFINGAFGIGTLFHAFLELYFGKHVKGIERKDFVHTLADLHEIKFEAGVDVDPEALEEAKRISSEYIVNFPSNHYGEVLFVEKDFDAKDKEVIEAAVGISPWTGQVDMGIRTTKASTKFLQSKFGLDVKPKTKYLVDWKSERAEMSTLREKFTYRNQFKAYLAAANAVEEKYGREPYAGLIADVVIKTKHVKFVRVLCEAPSEQELAALHERWRAVQVMQLCLPDWANASEMTCFPMWGTCSHFLESRCDRGPSKLSSNPLVPLEELKTRALAAQMINAKIRG